MTLEESSKAYRERIEKMTEAELNAEIVRQVNIIRRDDGLPPVKDIDEVNRLTSAGVPTFPEAKPHKKMSFWQRMKYGLGLQKAAGIGGI